MAPRTSSAKQESQLDKRELKTKVKQISHVFFDVDGTLIDDDASNGSVWGRIHQLAGISQQTRKLRQRRHQDGRITYEEWMSLDIEGWQKAGVTKDQILSVCNSMKISEGARETVETLHARGYVLGIISSSLDVGVFSLLDPMLFQECWINRLFFDSDGRLSGWDTSACKLAEKGARLREWAKQKEIDSAKIAFVGNDFNDVGAAEFAGVSFAFNCKSPDLERVVSWTVDSADLSSILDFFPEKN